MFNVKSYLFYITHFTWKLVGHNYIYYKCYVLTLDELLSSMLSLCVKNKMSFNQTNESGVCVVEPVQHTQDIPSIIWFQ